MKRESREVQSMRITRWPGGPILRLALLTVACVSAAPASVLAEGTLETVSLGSGLAMLVGPGGNVGVSVGDDGAMLIDDKFAPLAPQLEEAVLALQGGKIRFVLNTHWHGDHTGGNEALGAAGAVIFSHANARLRMSEDQWNPFFQRTTKAQPARGLPIVTFEDGLSLHLNGQDVDVRSVGPAHTDGDAIVVFRQANVIHMGDVYFNGLYPFIDLASGGSVDGMIRAVEIGLSRSDEESKIIPGHGPLSDREGLERYGEMLRAVRDAVFAQIASGKTVEEVIASQPSRAYDARLGGGFVSPEDFARMIYQSASAER